MQEAQAATGRSRRAVLVAGVAGTAGVAGVAALAGCGSSGPPGPPPDGGPGTVLARTAEVPVGGGLVVPDYQLVITQPTLGEFRAFSAICTHAGCLMSAVSGGTINCPCHGSRFSIQDGSVTRPASGAPFQQQAGLPQARITVDGESIELA